MRLLALLSLALTLPASSLRVRDGARWVEWWRAERAPARWTADDAVLARRVKWQRAADGVEWGELSVAGSGEARRTRLVVARLDPRKLRLSLDTAFRGGLRGGAWTVDRARERADVRFAVNAGQFVQALPWGWVVLDGRQFLPPGRGPLATAMVVDSAGAVHWLHGGAALASKPRGVAWAFQSYPALLRDGEVPAPLRAGDGLVDVTHRDARAAIGRLADGSLLVALTRFDLFGDKLGFVPLGLTTPEMAAVMGALGARDAMLLDGGISAQMLVRDAGGDARAWEGSRAVPLALVARGR